MLQIWEVLLQLPEGQRLHQSFGSVLHGALMQYAHTDFAEAMHRSALRPFSQFVYYDKARGSAVWQLAVLNKEAAEEIFYASGRLPQNLYLKQKEYVVQLSKPQPVKQTSYKDMAEQFFTIFNFITSASFKAFGSYKIYPDNVYIFRSLLKRWNAFCGGLVLEENNLEEHLAQAVKVTGYNLSLQQYSVGGAPIDAFKGRYRLIFRGTQSQNRTFSRIRRICRYRR